MLSMDGMEDYEMPEPGEVPRRLGTLGGDGFTVELLLNAIRRGQLAADFCTPSHPKSYPGNVQYGETNAGLREQTAALGWSFNDEDNIPRTVSPDGSIVVTALSGNKDTGRRWGKHASSKRPRGTASLRIVRRNAQLFLSEDLLPPEQRYLAGEEVIELGPMWYLLYCRDGDIVRSELSLAKDVSETGALLKWQERLVLPELDLNKPEPTSGDRGDAGLDVDVPVERRVG